MSKKFFYSTSALALMLYLSPWSAVSVLAMDEEGKKRVSVPLQPQRSKGDDVKGMGVPAQDDNHGHSAPAAAVGGGAGKVAAAARGDDPVGVSAVAGAGAGASPHEVF